MPDRPDIEVSVPVVVSRRLLRKLWGALDTAYGVIDLVDQDRKPIDLQACWEEVGEARDALERMLDE